MPKSYKPKLSLVTEYQIEQQQNYIHSSFFAEIQQLQASSDGSRPKISLPSGIYSRLPPIPKSPHEVRFKLAQYSQSLFNTEAPFYHASPTLARALKALKKRVIETISSKVAEIEHRNQPYSLKYHELSYAQMREAMEEGMRQPTRSLLGGGEKTAQTLGKPKRASSTITSLAAAQKMEAYIEKKNIGMTEFATRAGITDRTLRSFRKTGKIRRSLVEGIAKAMGITKEELLS
jgi:DNA-binding Xre family transcriptional regulator